MKSKRTRPALSRASKAVAPRRRRAPNPLTPANRRLGKRLLQFYELPEPERSRAFNAWLNSVGSPNRNATRQQQVREFFDLMEAIAETLTPRQRASLRSLGNSFLSKASRELSANPAPQPAARPAQSHASKIFTQFFTWRPRLGCYAVT